MHQRRGGGVSTVVATTTNSASNGTTVSTSASTSTSSNKKSSSATSSLPVPSLPRITTALGKDGRGYPSMYAATPGMKQYTWEEIAEHNTKAKGCWVYTDHRVFDITDFIDRHPGGTQILLLCAGRDITDLLISYHPFVEERVRKILDSYQIGETSTTEFPQYPPDSGFYKEVRKEIAAYFNQTGIDSKNPLGVCITFFFLASIAFICFYGILYDHGRLPLSIRILCAVIYGVCQALSLMHVMHDASHTAFGHHENWWFWMGRIVTDWFCGGSLTAWNHNHVLGHHVYTNVLGIDPDLPAKKEGDIRRLSPHQIWSSRYQFQHLYLCILYLLIGLLFRFLDILGVFVERSIGAIRVNLAPYELSEQFLSKVFWVCWRFFVPYYFFDLDSYGSFLLLSLILESTTGLYLTIIIQISHISALTTFPSFDKKNKSSIREEWAPCQLSTTLDYGYHSRIVTFLCAGLNYQAVHHLFPSISQYNLPGVAPIVKRVAEKYGISFKYEDSFLQVVKYHFQHLHGLGTKEIYQEFLQEHY